MSMTLYLVKVPPSLGERIKADPDLLLQVWSEVEVVDPDIAGLDAERDKLLEDYRLVGRIVLDEPEEFPWLESALHGTGEEVGFEYGYGPGFVITADGAARIVAGLAEEGWWRTGEPVITIDHAVAEFYAIAAEQGRTVIGGIG